MRYTKTVDWFTMWKMDRESILITMHRNMQADIDCGYDVFGKSITNQRQEIAAYEQEYYDIMGKFALMTEEEVNHYCFYDLLRRGAIE